MISELNCDNVVHGWVALQLQMLLSKEVEPTDQLVKSLIDQAHMKFQAINKEQLAKKNARTRGIPENSVGVTCYGIHCQVYLSAVMFTSAL